MKFFSSSYGTLYMYMYVYVSCFVGCNINVMVFYVSYLCFTICINFGTCNWPGRLHFSQYLYCHWPLLRQLLYKLHNAIQSNKSAVLVCLFFFPCSFILYILNLKLDICLMKQDIDKTWRTWFYMKKNSSWQ